MKLPELWQSPRDVFWGQTYIYIYIYIIIYILYISFMICLYVSWSFMIFHLSRCRKTPVFRRISVFSCVLWCFSKECPHPCLPGYNFGSLRIGPGRRGSHFRMQDDTSEVMSSYAIQPSNKKKRCEITWYGLREVRGYQWLSIVLWRQPFTIVSGRPSWPSRMLVYPWGILI